MHRCNNYLYKILNETLIEISKQTRIPKSRLLDEDIKDLIKKYEKKD